jgi:hypothetical protein
MMYERFLFFSLETKGVNHGRQITNIDNLPDIKQLSYLLYNDDEINISSGNVIIQQNESDQGFPLYKAMHVFLSAVINSDVIVSLDFDYNYNILKSIARSLEIEKHLDAIFASRKKICIKEQSFNICKTSFTQEGFKEPNLVFLHQYLFNSTFPENNLEETTKACAKSFFELKKRGFLKKIFI